MIKNNFINIKASFQKCPIEERATFKNSKCILPISIGYKAFEGDRLEAFFKLINKSFNSCLIVIGDSLQRHTIKIGTSISDEEAYRKANFSGDQWLMRCQKLINQFTIPIEIKRWDVWLNSNSLFLEYKNKINQLYKNDAVFSEVILKNAIEFVKNKQAHDSSLMLNQDIAIKFSIEYLKEECAIMCLWVNEKCDFEVYPSGRNLAMTITYDKLIKPLFPHLLKPVSIRYRNY